MITFYKEVEEISGAGYPVGTDMSGVYRIVNAMYNELIEIYKDTNQSIRFLCRGSSGAILAGCVAYLFEKNNYIDCRVLHIKKPGEISHQEHIYIREKDKLIIIDDFITSGNTVNAIHAELLKYSVPFEIDTLIVGGLVETKRLDFKPNYILSKEIKISFSQEDKYKKL
jgi:adenine/guanine phosphoribosyltransferase-like PRPP-binding protein